MSESDPLRIEANRAAHRVARAAARYRGEVYRVNRTTLPLAEKIRATDEALRPFNEALDAYEEIERRQQKEATA